MREAYFLVPVKQDEEKGHGRRHDRRVWKALEKTLCRVFGGLTKHSVYGTWIDDNGDLVEDFSTKYVVAYEPGQEGVLRTIAKGVATDFAQQSVYLNIDGEVMFVKEGITWTQWPS